MNFKDFYVSNALAEAQIQSLAYVEPITGGCHVINPFGSVLEADFEPIWGPSWPPKRTPKQSQIDIKF